MNKYIQENINQLMQREMDRREFLKFAIMSIIALTGFSAFFKSLPQSHRSYQRTSTAYGSSVYGGKARTKNK